MLTPTPQTSFPAVEHGWVKESRKIRFSKEQFAAIDRVAAACGHVSLWLARQVADIMRQGHVSFEDALWPAAGARFDEDF